MREPIFGGWLLLGGVVGDNPGDKNGMKQLMRVWKLYKITDNPRLDFNKMRKFYNKPLLTQIFLLTKFPVPVPAMTPVKSVGGVGAGVRLPGRKLESVKCHLCRVPVKCS